MQALEMRLCPVCAANMGSARNKRGEPLRFVSEIRGAPKKRGPCAMHTWNVGDWPLYRMTPNPLLHKPRAAAPTSAAGRRDRDERRRRA